MCVREKERERVFVYVYVCVCLCVCVRGTGQGVKDDPNEELGKRVMRVKAKRSVRRAINEGEESERTEQRPSRCDADRVARPIEETNESKRRMDLSQC